MLILQLLAVAYLVSLSFVAFGSFSVFAIQLNCLLGAAFVLGTAAHFVTNK